MKDKVLITGASGFLGYHLLHEAKSRGLCVHAAIRSKEAPSHIKPMIDSCIQLPYHSVEKMIEILKREDYKYIIHAAASTRERSDEVYSLVNVTYAKNLAMAAAAVQQSLKSFLFVSSLAAIGPLEYETPSKLTELSPMRPVTGYGRSKMRAECLLRNVSGLPLTIIRPTAIYGPREKDLLVLFKTILSGWDVYIGKTPQKLSFVYVEDVARVILDAIELRKDLPYPRVYNITDGQVYNRYELAAEIQKIVNKKSKRVYVPTGIVQVGASILDFLYQWSKKPPVLYPERINELTAPNWACDIRAAEKDLDYIPKYDLKEGLEETLSWYRNEGWISKY